MSDIQFLFDENTPPLLRLALLRKWPEIVARRVDLPGAPKHCASDRELLTWCEAHQFLLVTRSRALLPAYWKEPLPESQPAPGLFMLDEKTTTREVVETLALFWLTTKAEDFINSVIYRLWCMNIFSPTFTEESSQELRLRPTTDERLVENREYISKKSIHAPKPHLSVTKRLHQKKGRPCYAKFH